MLAAAVADEEDADGVCGHGQWQLAVCYLYVEVRYLGNTRDNNS
jgi:hypothetical protein